MLKELNYNNIQFFNKLDMIPKNIISTSVKLLTVPTKPFEGQKAGTSGLRKQVKQFKKAHYIENFIQSYFLSLRRDELSAKSVLLVGGDGRYYNIQAIFKIINLACANGVDEIQIPIGGLMSTPACSAHIRKINKDVGNCLGAIILTASHNPGGQDHDFGIKFNSRNGGPAQQQFTNAIYQHTLKIDEYHTTEFQFQNVIHLDQIKEYIFTSVQRPLKKSFVVRIVQNVQGYVSLMKQLFDFQKIKKLFQRKDFTFKFDGMNGISGPYAKVIFQKQFNCQASSLINCVSKPDFGGLHPDPNLTYAEQLVQIMGIFNKKVEGVPQFGAACDGDADRNMILGKGFFVTPSDSIAILAANSELFLKQKIKGVARSMPTSGALDKVANKLGLKYYQVPTGWKFFGNLMDTQLISLCGQQSFGTGSSHIRQKDGLWTVLAWLSIIAEKNVSKTEQNSLIGVQSIVEEFWKTYGRNYYSRYDYQSCQVQSAKKVWNHLIDQIPKYQNKQQIYADIYQYKDPVDKSISKNQGIRFLYHDGSRVIFRQSGTGSVGATIRIYFQKYEPTKINLTTQQALKQMIQFGLNVSQIKQFTQKQKPDVVT